MKKIALIALVGLCSSPVSAGVGRRPGTDPESLFREMEARLARVRTLQLCYSIDGEDGGDTFNLNGSLLWEKGNKLRIEVPPLGGDGDPWRIVSNGSTMASGRARPAADVPKNLDAFIADVLSWSGYIGFLGGLNGEGLAEESIREFLDSCKLSDFKIERREAIAGRAAVCVSYRVSSRKESDRDSLRGRVWIDTSRSLPLKREYRLNEKLCITETYSDLVADQKIDPSHFDPN
jgi:outer membrane lipoprotein-sorting protein